MQVGGAPMGFTIGLHKSGWLPPDSIWRMMEHTIYPRLLGMVYNIKWAEKSNCAGLPTELFFESYEEDSAIAKQVDSLCMTCSIQRECLSIGVGRREWGVWGGIFLRDGDVSGEANQHKTDGDWSALWLRLTTLTK
jgi:hypothetical protein